MKAVEFYTEMRADHTLRVPAGIADSIPQGQVLRVLLLVDGDGDERVWEQLAALELGQGYADSDAIYDQLSSG